MKLPVPDIVVFLLLGIVLGPAVLGLVAIPADSPLNRGLLIFGACYLLFDGGTTLRLPVLKRVWFTIVSLSTIGVVITAGVTALAAQALLGLSPLVAMLLGCVIAPTDPATLVPVFRQVKVKERVAQTVVSESAFNDATGAILAFGVLGAATGAEHFSVTASLIGLAYQAGVGVAIGGAIGYAVTWLVTRVRLFGHLVPAMTLAGVAGSYLGAEAALASGFMAVFVFGLLFGIRESLGLHLPAQAERRHERFVRAVTLVLRLVIFVLLGTQVDFALVGDYFMAGIGVVAVFMFLGRPLTVMLCAAPDLHARWTRRELLFMCWTRETGVIPAALAGLLIGLDAPGADVIAAVTFIAILATILLQATTTKWLAKKLHLLEA